LGKFENLPIDHKTPRGIVDRPTGRFSNLPKTLLWGGKFPHPSAKKSAEDPKMAEIGPKVRAHIGSEGPNQTMLAMFLD